MGIDYAFRFGARELDEDSISDDDIVAAFRAQGVTAATTIDDVPEALRSVICRSLATAALAATPDPLPALHRHFCDRWGRARWLDDHRIGDALRERGLPGFSELVAGPTDLWHSASLARRITSATISILRETPSSVGDVDDAVSGLACLEQIFVRAEADGRDVQFVIMP